MNLTVEQLVARAIKALETGQPNIAVLYMRKALVLLAVDRTIPSLQAIMDMLRPAVMTVGDVYTLVSENLKSFQGLMAEAFAPVINALVACPGQSDFALAADT